jgi:hypothetical protein
MNNNAYRKRHRRISPYTSCCSLNWRRWVFHIGLRVDQRGLLVFIIIIRFPSSMLVSLFSMTARCCPIDWYCRNDARLRDCLLVYQRHCSHRVRCIDLRFLGRQRFELRSLTSGAAILLSVVEDITDPLSAHVVAEGGCQLDVVMDLLMPSAVLKVSPSLGETPESSTALMISIDIMESAVVVP